MLSRAFVVSLCTLAYPSDVYCPPWWNPTILFIFNLIRSSRKHSLEAKGIGANEALDYLWVLSIPSIPDSLNSISNSVLDDTNSYSEWKQLICFSWLFKEHIAPVLVSAGALFFGPTGWQPSRQLLSLKVGKGMRQWSQTPGYGLQQSHTTVCTKEQELERFWFGPKSLIISLYE